MFQLILKKKAGMIVSVLQVKTLWVRKDKKLAHASPSVSDRTGNPFQLSLALVVGSFHDSFCLRVYQQCFFSLVFIPVLMEDAYVSWEGN